MQSSLQDVVLPLLYLGVLTNLLGTRCTAEGKQRASETETTPHPSLLHGKIVFHEISPWHQKIEDCCSIPCDA